MEKSLEHTYGVVCECTVRRFFAPTQRILQKRATAWHDETEIVFSGYECLPTILSFFYDENNLVSIRTPLGLYKALADETRNFCSNLTTACLSTPSDHEFPVLRSTFSLYAFQ